ncbi:hypothetical protein GCM10007989_10020 [Devosia pacifica]|uniref:SH3b domain-containing protein n=1 Tax=Devosia pacifica TaxID=1335967 RepID=A0A918RZE9_9HYPH|nr:SH3 domain-containing protein [Devosia pacifica]GHA16838.1 hypothetical protein GCM10007989_10020 [Devosia pacifica]
MSKHHARRPIRVFLAAALALVGAAAATAPAHAVYGSLAWARWDSIVRQGPGMGYPVIGEVLKDARIVVYSCEAQWCLIGGKQDPEGWVARDRVDFGLGPYGD